MATPGELAAAAAKRFWYARIVLRSIPATRSISRWLAPASSNVATSGEFGRPPGPESESLR